MTITIRHIRVEDAANFLALGLALDEETRFMMLEPGERSTDLDRQRERLAGIAADANQTILVAEAGEELVGFLGIHGGNFARNRRTAHLVCGIRAAYTGQGLGSRLFSEMEVWARAQGLHRLELTVMSHNEAAVKLYQKQGFEIEGTKKDSLFVDGRFLDEYYMAKLLTPHA